MKLNHLFQCTEDSAFARNVGYEGHEYIGHIDHMQCIPFGSIVGTGGWSIVIFGMGTFDLLMRSNDSGKFRNPSIAKRGEEATKIMESLLEQLDEYHGKI